jgi:hypothetical protein
VPGGGTLGPGPGANQYTWTITNRLDVPIDLRNVKVSTLSEALSPRDLLPALYSAPAATGRVQGVVERIVALRGEVTGQRLGESASNVLSCLTRASQLTRSGLASYRHAGVQVAMRQWGRAASQFPGVVADVNALVYAGSVSNRRGVQWIREATVISSLLGGLPTGGVAVESLVKPPERVGVRGIGSSTYRPWPVEGLKLLPSCHTSLVVVRPTARTGRRPAVVLSGQVSGTDGRLLMSWAEQATVPPR